MTWKPQKYDDFMLNVNSVIGHQTETLVVTSDGVDKFGISFTKQMKFM